MATNQYIGARYVPIFAEPLDWDSTRKYEALTIVYYAGNSFTSRQAVPKGIDITNEKYWALTGNYNAQIEAYRKEVQAHDGKITQNAKDIAAEVTNRIAADNTLTKNLNAEITRAKGAESTLTTNLNAEVTRAKGAESTLTTNLNTEITRAKAAEKVNADAIAKINEKKHFVALGDSFGVDSATSPNWWHTYVSGALGLINHNYCEGYDGFVTTNPTSKRCFLDRAKEAAADTSFKNEDVACVVVYGGLNDRTQTSESLITSAIQTLANYISENFKNAKIYFAGPNSWCYWTISNPSLANTYGTWEFFMGATIAHAVHQIPRVHFIPIYGITGHTNLFAGTADGNHFSAAGSKAAAQAILCGIEGGFYDGGVLYGANGIVKDPDGNTLASNANWAIRFNGNSFEIEIKPPEIVYSSSTLEIELPNRFRMPGALSLNSGLIYKISNHTSSLFPPLLKGPSSTHPNAACEIQFVDTTKKEYLSYMKTHILY